MSLSQPNALRISCGRPRGGRKDADDEAPCDNRRRANAMVPYLVPPGSFMRGLDGTLVRREREAMIGFRLLCRLQTSERDQDETGQESRNGQV